MTREESRDDNLFELDFQTYYQHRARTIEGIFARGGVDTAIHTVENVVDTDGWLQKHPFGNVECMGGIEVPDAIAWCVLIAWIVGLALQTSVQVDIQPVTFPCVVIVSCYRGRMTDLMDDLLNDKHFKALTKDSRKADSDTTKEDIALRN